MANFSKDPTCVFHQPGPGDRCLRSALACLLVVADDLFDDEA